MPPFLKQQTNNYESLVGTLAHTVHDLAGARDGLTFLVNQIEAEPRWLRYNNQDGWSRHGWTIAEVPVSPSAPLTGHPIGAANEPGQARVIALRHRDGNDLDWAPAATDELRPLDRLIVVATQAGLGRLLARSMAPTPSNDV